MKEIWKGFVHKAIEWTTGGSISFIMLWVRADTVSSIFKSRHQHEQQQQTSGKSLLPDVFVYNYKRAKIQQRSHNAVHLYSHFCNNSTCILFWLRFHISHYTMMCIRITVMGRWHSFMSVIRTSFLWGAGFDSGLGHLSMGWVSLTLG